MCISVQKYLISYGAESTFNLGPDRLGSGTTWAESTWGRNDLKPNASQAGDIIKWCRLKDPWIIFTIKNKRSAVSRLWEVVRDSSAVQWLFVRLVSLGHPVSSTNETYHHDIQKYCWKWCFEHKKDHDNNIYAERNPGWILFESDLRTHNNNHTFYLQVLVRLVL